MYVMAGIKSNFISVIPKPQNFRKEMKVKVTLFDNYRNQ